MPAPATTIAAQVRTGRRWPSARRATSAVSNGASAIVIRTLATVVIVIATMKAVNMTDQHRPESQSVAVVAGERPGERGETAQAAEQDDQRRAR